MLDSLEGTDEQAQQQEIIESLTFQKGTSVIDQTLDEIQSLRLVEKELESQKSKIGSQGQAIDPELIEEETLKKVKKDPHASKD